MKFAHLYHKLYCTPLMLTREAFAAFDAVLQARMGVNFQGGSVAPIDPEHRDAPMEDYLEYYRQARATKEQLRVENVLRKYGSVAVISVHGAIDRNLTDMEMQCYGGYDLNDYLHALQDADADASIQTVVSDYDTPGGSVVGLKDCAQQIASMRSRKNMLGTTFGQCCSAGMYLASQNHQMVIGEGAYAGSIGVYCARLDMTGALEKAGIGVSLITSSEQKADGSPFKPMTEAERARLQSEVDALYVDFKDTVKAGRPDVNENAMQAQVFRGRDAISAGLADVTASSLEDVLDQLING